MVNEHQLLLRGLKPFFPLASDRELLRAADRATTLFAYEDDLPMAFVIIAWPADKTAEPYPQILHFHNEGPQALRVELVQRTLDLVKEQGYNRLRAVNGSGMPDEVWKRIFGHKDWNLRPVGTVFEFEVK